MLWESKKNDPEMYPDLFATGEITGDCLIFAFWIAKTQNSCNCPKQKHPGQCVAGVLFCGMLRGGKQEVTMLFVVVQHIGNNLFLVIAVNVVILPAIK